MRQWLRSRLTYANVTSSLALFIALAGGTAWAAHEVINSSDVVDNSLQSVDLKDNAGVKSTDVVNDTVTGGGLAGADLRPSSVGTSEIQNGQVSVLDTNRVIPSGATVTGLLGEFEHGGGVVPLREHVDFHGLRAPADLTDADVGFDDVGVSAAAAANTEENANCTGGIFNPTAPSGKVCIYLFFETVDNGTAAGHRFGSGTTFTEADRYGFTWDASSSVSPAELRGTWAYRAP